MNKKYFIERLQKELNIEEEKAKSINKILEETLVVGRKNKNKIIERLIIEMNVSEKEADQIYETVIDIIGSGIKEKLKHPFKDLDK